MAASISCRRSEEQHAQTRPLPAPLRGPGKAITLARAGKAGAGRLMKNCWAGQPPAPLPRSARMGGGRGGAPGPAQGEATRIAAVAMWPDFLQAPRAERHLIVDLVALW